MAVVPVPKMVAVICEVLRRRPLRSSSRHFCLLLEAAAVGELRLMPVTYPS